MPYITESALATLQAAILEKDQMVKFDREQAVFTIGALSESIERTDVGRVKPSTSLAGVDAMYEQNLAGKIESLVKIRLTLSGVWEHLDKTIQEVFDEMMLGYDHKPWKTSNWWYVWNAYAAFRGWNHRRL